MMLLHRPDGERVRNERIRKMLVRGYSPKKIVVLLQLSSVWVVYNAKRRVGRG